MTALEMKFNFRNKEYGCIVYIDISEEPYYLFVTLADSDLIDKFEAEIAIITDLETRIPNKDEQYAIELAALRQAIFDVAVLQPEFTACRQKLAQRKTSRYKG